MHVSICTQGKTKTVEYTIATLGPTGEDVKQNVLEKLFQRKLQAFICCYELVMVKEGNSSLYR